jgi:hypothetical protein
MVLKSRVAEKYFLNANAPGRLLQQWCTNVAEEYFSSPTRPADCFSSGALKTVVQKNIF